MLNSSVTCLKWYLLSSTWPPGQESCLVPRLEVDETRQVLEVTVPLIPSGHLTALPINSGDILGGVSESFKEHLEQKKISALLDLERKIFLTLLDVCVSSW